MRQIVITIVVGIAFFTTSGCDKVIEALNVYPALDLNLKRTTNGNPFEDVLVSTQDPAYSYTTGIDGNVRVLAYDQSQRILVNFRWWTSAPYKQRTKDLDIGLEKGTRQLTLYFNDNPYDPYYKPALGGIVRDDGTILVGNHLIVPASVERLVLDDQTITIIEFR